jgi:DNA polymerase-3 subunit epsilon
MFSGLMSWLRSSKVPTHMAFHNMTLASLPLLAIDLELTSLDAKQAEITSIGWVGAKNYSIDLSTCRYEVIQTNAVLGQSPVIHGLTSDLLKKGRPLKEVVSALYPLLKEHVLVFHNATLDLAALNKAIMQCGLPSVSVTFIDTLQLAVYQLKKQHQVLPNNSATLTVCRQRLGLPVAPEHNALDDALATLQLLLAQYAQLGVTTSSTFGDMKHTHAIGRKTIGER